MWLYGSGFPKSMDIEKAINKKEGQSSDKAEEWSGWGTALKPSFEPIIVARKPLDGTCINNVIKWGTGGINIDECRVGNEVITQLQKDMTKYHGNKLGAGHHTQMTGVITQTVGRFPANTILTYDDTDFEEVCSGFPVGKKNGSITKRYKINNQVYGDYGYCNEWEAYNDSVSASRYFYNAKAGKKDRDEGLEERFATKLRNSHPTVKPTSLMQYLVRLVTPKGGAILDPFMGSGSTGKATAYENNERDANYKFIGIETSKEYCDIAKARIEFAINQKGEKKNE